MFFTSTIKEAAHSKEKKSIQALELNILSLPLTNSVLYTRHPLSLTSISSLETEMVTGDWGRGGRRTPTLQGISNEITYAVRAEHRRGSKCSFYFSTATFQLRGLRPSEVHPWLIFHVHPRMQHCHSAPQPESGIFLTQISQSAEIKVPNLGGGQRVGVE